MVRLGIRARVLAVIAAVGALVAVAPIAMTAAGAAPTNADASQALLRGGHFSPDTPGVDVYLTALSGGTTSLWLSNVGYGDVSGYERINPGVYAVAMRPHGAAASTPPALSWTLDAQAGSAYTAAAVGMSKSLKGIVLSDQLTPPAAGEGRIRVIQAASQAASADVVAVGGPVVAKDAAFGTTTDYASVPAGTWSLQASSVNTPSITTTATVTVTSGSVDSVVLLDGKSGGITLKSIVDAAGAGTMPTGPVSAGGGGTAPNAPSQWRADTLLGLGIALAAAGAVGIRRATRRARVA